MRSLWGNFWGSGFAWTSRPLLRGGACRLHKKMPSGFGCKTRICEGPMLRKGRKKILEYPFMPSALKFRLHIFQICLKNHLKLISGTRGYFVLAYYLFERYFPLIVQII